MNNKIKAKYVFYFRSSAITTQLIILDLEKYVPEFPSSGHKKRDLQLYAYSTGTHQ